MSIFKCSESCSPFGMVMSGRVFNSGDYMYGFGGMEKDDEVKGIGNSYTSSWRGYDSRIGRWASLDPKAAVTPAQSPYSFAYNSPISYTDPEGNVPILPGIFAALAEVTVGEPIVVTALTVGTAYVSFELAGSLTDAVFASDITLRVDALTVNYHNPNLEILKEQQRQNRRDAETAANAAIAIAKMINDTNDRYNNNQRGDGNDPSGVLPKGVAIGAGVMMAGYLVGDYLKFIEDARDDLGLNDEPESGEFEMTYTSVNPTHWNDAIEITIEFDVYHTIKSGERLTSDSERYGIGIDDLVDNNGIADRDKNKAGDTIKVGCESQSFCVPAE